MLDRKSAELDNLDGKPVHALSVTRLKARLMLVSASTCRM